VGGSGGRIDFLKNHDLNLHPEALRSGICPAESHAAIDIPKRSSVAFALRNLMI
jgi:hypothetical protein